MSADAEVITLSDEDTEEAPPAKKVKAEEQTSNGDSVKINGNGKLKLTARKRMSSFTPKLKPTPCITLEEDENQR